MSKHLKRYFKIHTSGILHFTNCCYGFWYSRSTDCYYYLDPYQCDKRGRKTSSDGKACLCIFSSVCQMVKHMCLNQYRYTTGFFIHRLHVDSIDAPFNEKFQEDPMWIYLDYQWNYTHKNAHTTQLSKKMRNNDKVELTKKIRQRFWNNYAVEVDDVIYSLWGTIGAYDYRFGERAGKNRVAICVAILAMQYLCHPSRWSSAILDSAVICGDCYYTESLKGLARKYSNSTNRFRLRTRFKIFPHLWSVNFGTSVCGILYGDQNRLALAGALKLVFEEAQNVIIECNGITLAALSTKDAYYVADPCWIGPPLFTRDHGAIYVLRCKNFNSLLYAITKMFNTNQRLEIRVTPVVFTFDHESLNFAKPEPCSHVKGKILSSVVRRSPGKIEQSAVVRPISGAVVVPDQDSYQQYRQRLIEGITRGYQLENPQLPHIQLPLKPENANNTVVSTRWHLNLDQVRSLKRIESASISSRKKPKFTEYIDSTTTFLFEEHRTPQVSITDLLTVCDDYPRPIDFTDDAFPPRIKSLECVAKRSFIREKNRARFNERTARMQSQYYKDYQHRLTRHKGNAYSEMDASRTDDGFKDHLEVYEEVQLRNIPINEDIGKESKLKTETATTELTDTNYR